MEGQICFNTGKKWTYILLPATIIIWGLVGYSIYTGLKEEEVEANDNTNILPPVLMNTGVDTFSLFNNYRDPFLTDLHRSFVPRKDAGNDHSPKITNKVIPSVKMSTPPSSDWPSIQYAGIIKNQSSSTALVLLNVGGKVYTIKQGDMVDGLKLLSVSNSEVVLVKGKEKRTFPK